MALVAWSTIKNGEKTIALGDEVSAADVGGKDELERLKAEGVVRDKKYPVPADVAESPRQHRLAMLRAEVEELQSGTDDSMAELAVADRA
jgi:hypothetical protein